MSPLAEKAQLLEPLPWLPVLETGHAEVDREHRQLIEDANLIHAIIGERRPWADLVAAAHDMRDRCVEHFATEDRVLKETRFPDLDRHLKTHRRILKEVDSIVEQLTTVSVPNRLHWELALSLRGILLDHMLRDDLKYKSHLMYFEPGREA